MLYDKVKAICRKKGVSVGKMEKDLGFSNGSVYKWNENEPSVGKVQKVADYLGVTVDELLAEGAEAAESEMEEV